LCSYHESAGWQEAGLGGLSCNAHPHIVCACHSNAAPRHELLKIIPGILVSPSIKSGADAAMKKHRSPKTMRQGISDSEKAREHQAGVSKSPMKSPMNVDAATTANTKAFASAVGPKHQIGNETSRPLMMPIMEAPPGLGALLRLATGTDISTPSSALTRALPEHSTNVTVPHSGPEWFPAWHPLKQTLLPSVRSWSFGANSLATMEKQIG